jgi:hypothetical protein
MEQSEGLVDELRCNRWDLQLMKVCNDGLRMLNDYIVCERILSKDIYEIFVKSFDSTTIEYLCDMLLRIYYYSKKHGK